MDNIKETNKTLKIALFGTVFRQLDELILSLNDFCNEHNIDETHGFDHAVAVSKNALKAIECWNTPINIHIQLMIILASLLHDVDDKKYFPDSINYDNAKNLLSLCFKNIFTKKDIKLIINMIDLVSASKNKDIIPKKTPHWMLIPRYSDRLEAIGIIGLKRNLGYTIEKGMPIYLETTEKAHNIDEIQLIATKERYKNYNGVSDSMLGHIYDKLLHIKNFPVKNDYFNYECKKRMEPFVNFVLKFGRNEITNIDDIRTFINECS